MEFKRIKTEVVRMLDENGDTLIEAPAIDLDMLFSKALSGLNYGDAYDTPVWLDRAIELISEDYKVELTRQDAFHLANITFKVMEPLKKSCLDLQI